MTTDTCSICGEVENEIHMTYLPAIDKIVCQHCYSVLDINSDKLNFLYQVEFSLKDKMPHPKF